MFLTFSDPHNIKMDPHSSKVSVIRIEEININNAQVIPLHILDSVSTYLSYFPLEVIAAIALSLKKIL